MAGQLAHRLAAAAVANAVAAAQAAAADAAATDAMVKEAIKLLLVDSFELSVVDKNNVIEIAIDLVHIMNPKGLVACCRRNSEFDSARAMSEKPSEDEMLCALNILQGISVRDIGCADAVDCLTVFGDDYDAQSFYDRARVGEEMPTIFFPYDIIVALNDLFEHDPDEAVSGAAAFIYHEMGHKTFTERRCGGNAMMTTPSDFTTAISVSFTDRGESGDVAEVGAMEGIFSLYAVVEWGLPPFYRIIYTPASSSFKGMHTVLSRDFYKSFRSSPRPPKLEEISRIPLKWTLILPCISQGRKQAAEVYNSMYDQQHSSAVAAPVTPPTKSAQEHRRSSTRRGMYADKRFVIRSVPYKSLEYADICKARRSASGNSK